MPLALNEKKSVLEICLKFAHITAVIFLHNNNNFNMKF